MPLTFNRRTLMGAAAALGFAAPAGAQNAVLDGVPDLFDLPVPNMERLSQTMWVGPLTSRIWIVCGTFAAGSYGDVATNFLIIDSDLGPTLVDTGNNPEQGALLLATTQRLTGRLPTQAIATHFHTDRTGGIAAMRAANVPVYAHPFSVGLAQAYGFPVPEPVAGLEKAPVVLGPVELFYPGAGHTRDNITVWHAESSTLFGGCLMRATTDQSLGSSADADFDAFPATLARLAARYPHRAITVPGHGAVGGDALAHSIELAANFTP